MNTRLIVTCNAALALLLTACGGASEVKRSPSSSAAAPQAVHAAAKGVLTGSNKGQYMKPGAPVQLSYTTDKVAAVGQISDIQAVLHLTSANVDQLQVDISTDEGVTIHRSPGSSIQLSVQPGQLDYPLQLSASAGNVGLSYINMIVTTVQNCNKQSRGLAIPFQVGSDEAVTALRKAKSPVVFDSDNNPVIPMQAEETIQ